MFKKFTDRYIDFIKKHTILVLSVYLIITAGLGFLGTKIGMKSDFIDLLSDKNKVIRNMKKVFKMYGGEGYLICTLEYYHDFYFLNSAFDDPDREYDHLFKTLDKWDPNDPVSTKKYLPLILNRIRIVNAYQQAFIGTLKSHKPKLKTDKGRAFLIKFQKRMDTASKELKSLFSVMAKPSATGKEMLSLLKKHFNTDNPDKVYDLLRAGVNRANSLYAGIKDKIKNEFVNEEGLKTTADIIASKVLKENPEDVRFVGYRQPIKWLKNHFFYLVESRDLEALHQELKKIHLSAVRVLGESKFQGVRNILNKYSVSIDDSDDEEETPQTRTNTASNRQAPVATAPNRKDYKYNLNKTKDMLILLIKPMGRSSDLDYSRMLINKVKKVLAEIDFSKIDKNIRAGLTGRYVKKVEDADTLSRDIKVTSLVATALIILFILIYFRRVRAIFATMIPLLSGLMWALGIVYLAVGYFNIITGFIVAILTGLGIDFGIHLLARYYEERKEGNDSAEALKMVFKTTLRGTITAATTTAFAFLCLIVTEFRGFSQFGYTIFLGLMFILLAMFVSFPCILIISERMLPINVSKLKRGKEESLSRLKGKKFPYPYAVLATGIAITFISFFFLPRFDFNFSNLRDTSNASIQLDKKISASFKVSLWPSIVYTADDATTREISESLRKRAKYSRELVDNLRAFHFTNFVKNITKRPEVYSLKRMGRETLDFLHRMRCEVSTQILTNYLKSVSKENFEAKKPYLKAIMDNYNLRLKSNYVFQYLQSLASEIAPAASPSEAPAPSAAGEENQEDFNLDVPDESSMVATISKKDKKRLDAFFDMLLEKNIPGAKEILKKPYDYKTILKNVEKLISAIKKDIYKSKEGINTLFDKIKNVFQFNKTFIKPIIDFKADNFNLSAFNKIRKKLILMYKDIFTNIAFHKTAGLDMEYIEGVKYLASKSEISIENQTEGDLYLALKKPYDMRKIGKALRVIFDDVDSIVKFLPDDQEERIETIKKIEHILNDSKFINKVKAKKDKNLLKEAKKIAKFQSGIRQSDLPEEISKKFSGAENIGGSFIYVYPNHGASMSDDTVIQAYSDYLKSIKSSHGGQVLFASETVVFADILRIIKEDGWLILTLTMLAIIIILLLDFRSFKALLFTNIPLIGGAIWMFIIMRIFDVRINYLNAAILPVILGVGIDEGVHIYHRWLEEGKNNLIFIIRTTGTAVFMADFTTAIGFAALMFANYRGLRTMGHLAAIGIMTAFVVAVTVLPALLQIVENIRSRREKKA